MKRFNVEDSAFGYIKMADGATVMLESAWALNILDVDEAKTSLCGTKAGADMKDGLRINKVQYNKQVVERPELDPVMSPNEGLTKTIEVLKEALMFEALGEIYWA